MKALTLVGIAFTLLLPIAIAVAERAAKDHAQSQTAGALVQTNDIPESVQTSITKINAKIFEFVERYMNVVQLDQLRCSL